MAKEMLIIAGPNGAGKSTFGKELLKNLNIQGKNDIVYLNADECVKKLRLQHPEETQYDLDLRAVKEIDRAVIECIKAGQNLMIDTVLSTDKYQDDVFEAKRMGYTIGLFYISLYPPELSPLRIKERVAKGGHNVNHEKAIARYGRSHYQLKWFAKEVDFFMAFDNSSCYGEPKLLAYRSNNSPLVYIARGVNPSVDQALDGMLES